MRTSGGPSRLGMGGGERNLIFYAANDRIAGQDNVWVQDAMSVTVAMFCRMGLEKLWKIPRPWSALQGSSGGSGESTHTSGGRQGKE